MTNKFFMGVAVVGLVFLGMLAFRAPAVAPDAGFGAANVTASNALNQQRLVNELNLIANPLVAIESSSTGAIDFANLTGASGTAAQATTTVIGGLAGSLGDAVIVEANTSSTGAAFVGQVQVASTTSATFQITEFAAAGTAVDVTNTTYTVLVLPHSTFVAPTGL